MATTDPTTTDARDPAALMQRVEELTESLDQIGDPFARAAADDLVSAVVDLYGEGLERILRALEEAGPVGSRLAQGLAEDGVVSSLLLIHGLYPVPLDQRVQEALESVRPYMHSHGGDVELISLEDGVARLRLQGSCHGCPGSAATLEQAISDALAEAAPDLAGLVVEGVEAPARRGEAA